MYRYILVDYIVCVYTISRHTKIEMYGTLRFQLFTGTVYRLHSTCVPKLWGNISHTKINCFWISVVYRSIVIPRYL